ncbi:hypothetical protein PF008_g27539 [Phytophthora fragariae]|uniref:Uncharacterized protein n=1 Tax=Phytophthora fragariae TaxID=53985 RepID=A0A6G0QDW9_9STRA|nr:hypothetical protein PF008_g27539 [Phytophthora fragariae]
MADFLEVLELSLSSLKSMQPGGRDDAAVVSKLTDETVFIRGGNGNIFSSEGIVMPLASKIQVKEGDNKKDMKLRLLRGWEEELEADEELTSDEGDSSSCSSSDEDSPVPETPKEDEVKTFIQAEARHKSQSVLTSGVSIQGALKRLCEVENVLLTVEAANVCSKGASSKL